MAVTATITGPTVTTVGSVTTRAYTVTFDLSAHLDTVPFRTISAPPYGWTSNAAGEAPVDFGGDLHSFLSIRNRQSGGGGYAGRTIGMQWMTAGAYGYLRSLRRYTVWSEGAGGTIADLTTIDFYASHIIPNPYSNDVNGWGIVGFRLPADVIALLSGFLTHAPTHAYLIKNPNIFYSNTIDFFTATMPDGWEVQPFMPSIDAKAIEGLHRYLLGPNVSPGTGSAGKLALPTPHPLYSFPVTATGTIVANLAQYAVISDTVRFGRAMWPDNNVRDDYYQHLIRTPVEHYSGASYRYRLYGGSATDDIEFKAYGADMSLLSTWTEPVTIPFAWFNGYVDIYAGIVDITPTVPDGTRYVWPCNAVGYSDALCDTRWCITSAFPVPCIDGDWIPGAVCQ